MIEFWPFRKRKPARLAEEWVKDLPLPECGDPVKHYTYKYNGAPCPECRRIHAERIEEQRENRLAHKIAEEVIRRIEETK